MTMPETTKDALQLRLLGELSVLRDGQPSILPASRKTRALLAYLAATGKSHRRERLCSLFWDVPDDPKGSLRWSLSKLRQTLNDSETERLIADREMVMLDLSGAHCDLAEFRATMATMSADFSDEYLIDLAHRCGAPFCDGLDLARCDEFESWCAAEREDIRRLQISLFNELVSRLEPSPEQALPFARRLTEIDPLNGEAWADLVDILAAAGRRGEAEQQRNIALRHLQAEHVPAPSRLRAPLASPETASEPTPAPDRSAVFQRIYFCSTTDGTTIAYSCIGDGPPLVKTANWLNHLEFDWDSPISRHWLDALAQQRTLIRYDERGNGLSDWNVEDISFEAFVDDLETVVDHLELPRFDLLGISQGCAVAIAYAVRHPERVNRLVLYGGYANGWATRGDPDEIARRQAMLTLTRQGWGQPNPAFRQMFSTLFFPDAPPEQTEWFNELQRISTSPEGAERLSIAFSQIDVWDLLPQVRVPTIIFHVRDDAVTPFNAGLEMARRIPGARFVALEGRNHLLLEHEPAWPKLRDTLIDFLNEQP